ncbi:hypothetical protein G6F64_015599 [Rhizopus arrhizus]|uniref:Uncharacterized protein n=1 Tax=Rhizopus oryzae TaxID=64495 RepID=A0A9P6WRP1_RHIOR|nr:hypothetical protein G6F64_015599 [Rhizopus arrhizus]
MVVAVAEARHRSQLPVRRAGLQRPGPGQDGNHRRGRPAHRDHLQWLEAQPGLRRRHLQLHPAEGHRRHR